MLNKRFKLNIPALLGFLTLAAFVALIPGHSQAANMKYGEWELDGFLRNNTGVWTKSWDYAPNQDPLATCRNWLRLNLNGPITDSMKLKAEILAIYEPEYDREDNSTVTANEYNYFDFREMRLDWRIGTGHNLRIGKQIVNWGEAVTGRVGDVVNSTDARWDLGFTNLEDQRTPTWMIRGLHQITSIGTTIDWIWAPYMEVSRWRTSRTLAWQTTLLTDGTNDGVIWIGNGTERFSIYPEKNIIVNGMKLNGLLPAGSPILFPPFQQMIYNGAAFPRPWSGVYKQTYPKSSLEDSRYGIKTSSTIMGAQTGVYAYRSHFSAWSTTTTHYDASTGDLVGVWDRINYYGVYANKNFDFGVLRTDICYAPDYTVSVSGDLSNAELISKFPDLTGEVDKLKVQIGFNKDFMIRPLNESQTFGLILEYFGDFLTGGDARDHALHTWVYNTKIKKDFHQFVASLGTNYNFGMWAPNLVMIYTSENNGMIQPSLTYVPDWMNRKWSFKLQYTNIFYEDKADWLYGLFAQKDMVVLTTQFSFP